MRRLLVGYSFEGTRDKISLIFFTLLLQLHIVLPSDIERGILRPGFPYSLPDVHLWFDQQRFTLFVFPAFLSLFLFIFSLLEKRFNLFLFLFDKRVGFFTERVDEGYVVFAVRVAEDEVEGDTGGKDGETARPSRPF